MITDRDIVCRVVAEGKNPIAHTAEQYMSQPVVTVGADAPLDEVVSTMEKHQIRRVPVVDERGCCTGIIAQADVAWTGGEHEVAALIREVSRETGDESRRYMSWRDLNRPSARVLLFAIGLLRHMLKA